MYGGGARNVKTPATVLQELMTKRGLTPEYECVAQSGPQHQSMFEYVCTAAGVSVRGAARSKKDAKQASARRALAALAARGDLVPSPYHEPLDAPPDAAPGPASAAPPGAAGAPPGGSHVALLRELCDTYRLSAPDYCLVADTGPAHDRHFTMSAEVGKVKFMATANSKKAARQAAADKLYSYLRENLARLTADFDEEEALVRAHEKAMERFSEASADVWRPHLGLKVADYPGALRLQGAEPAAAALAELRRLGDSAEGVAAALQQLGLTAEAEVLGGLRLLRVPRASPPLCFAAAPPADPAAAAARYLRLALEPAAQSAGGQSAGAAAAPGLA